jgi:hypothetical protein
MSGELQSELKIRIQRDLDRFGDWREHDRARWREEGRRFSPGEVAADLRARIQHELERFGGHMSERVAIVWIAYLWAAYTAGTGADVITGDEYEELMTLRPEGVGKEVVELFRKRTD